MEAIMEATECTHRRTGADTGGRPIARMMRPEYDLRTPANAGGRGRILPPALRNQQVTGSSPVISTT